MDMYIRRQQQEMFDSLLNRMNQQFGESQDYSEYKDDPIGFIEDILGETLTEDLKKICRSVVVNRVTFAQSGNGTGKSWISARLALWFFKCRVEPQVYCAAAPPESNLTNILWAEIATTCNKHPDLVSDSETKNLKIVRNPKEFITGVTVPSSGTDAQKQARFSGKHAASLLFVFDEGDAIPDPVYAGTETCMSGGFARHLVTFNPRERRGHVYRAIKEGRGKVIKISAFNHPSVIDGVNYFPGAVNREETLRRIAQWTRPLREGELRDKRCFELPDFLVGCIPKDEQGRDYPALTLGWYKITEHQFSHVVLGEYPAQADNQLISEEWIDSARSRYDMLVNEHGLTIPEHTRCICGLDIADMGADESVLAKRFGNFLHPLVSWNKQDIIEVGDKVHSHLRENSISSVSAIYCDSTGVGAGVAPYLTRQYNLPAVRVMVASKAREKTELGDFGLLLDELLWKMREWLRTDLATLPPDAELIEELLAYTYEIKNGKLKVSSTDDIKNLLKRSPDRSRSLMLTFMTTGFFCNMDLS